jgi:WD40 repeat protein
MVSDTHSRLVHCLSPCLSLCLSLSGCTGSEDQKVYLWNLQTKEIAQTLVGHTGAVLAVSAHPTEMIVASGGMAPDNTVKIWKDLSLVEGLLPAAVRARLRLQKRATAQRRRPLRHSS